MKKYILLTVFCFSFYIATSQTVKLEVGPTFSKIKWESSLASTDSVFDDNYTGVFISLGIEYLQKKNFSLSSNIGFYTNGGKGTIALSDIEHIVDPAYPVKTTLNFITLNSVAKYHFISDKKISPYIGLGIGVNYLTSYNENTSFLKQFDDIDELDRLLWGAIGKAGVNYDLINFEFGIEFVYNYNLNKLVNYEGMPGFLNKVSDNYSSVLFTFGYKLK